MNDQATEKPSIRKDVHACEMKKMRKHMNCDKLFEDIRRHRIDSILPQRWHSIEGIACGLCVIAAIDVDAATICASAKSG